MAAFKAGKKDILIATDVAARGIDVNDVTHVINHTVPDDPDTYLHRAGRTGRAGKTGIAVTFVDWDDMHKWALINRGLDFGNPEPVETYSSSPHLYTDLDIPEGTKGRLQRPARPRRARDASSAIAADRDSGAAAADPARPDRAPRQQQPHRLARRRRSSRRAGGGTHDGKGSEHHDGNAAPRSVVAAARAAGASRARRAREPPVRPRPAACLLGARSDRERRRAGCRARRSPS